MHLVSLCPETFSMQADAWPTDDQIQAANVLHANGNSNARPPAQQAMSCSTPDSSNSCLPTARYGKATQPAASAAKAIARVFLSVQLLTQASEHFSL
jgi:hypothetical protein